MIIIIRSCSVLCMNIVCLSVPMQEKLTQLVKLMGGKVEGDFTKRVSSRISSTSVYIYLCTVCFVPIRAIFTTFLECACESLNIIISTKVYLS